MGAFDALAKLILLVAYAAYSVIGLILLILGIYYVAQIPDAIDNVAIVPALDLGDPHSPSGAQHPRRLSSDS